MYFIETFFHDGLNSFISCTVKLSATHPRPERKPLGINAGAGPDSLSVQSRSTLCLYVVLFPHPSIAHTITDTASSEDLTELSFKKGEVLDILTKSDLWWEARKSDGTEGSQSFRFPLTHYKLLILTCILSFYSCTFELS